MKKLSNFFSLFLASFLLVLSLPTQAKTQHPPAARLSYNVQAKYNGMSLSGDATIDWKPTASTYTVRNTATVSFLGKILQTSSYGSLDHNGLRPIAYSEKRLRKDVANTHFDHATHTATLPNGQKVSFSDAVQDRSSVVWQLASLATANPKQVSYAHLNFSVAGKRHIKTMTFAARGQETLDTPLGAIKAVRFQQTNDPDHTMIVWLSPDHNWYPVKLRFIEKGSLEIEQTISHID